MKARPILLAAVLVGLLVGAGLAFALPRTAQRPAAVAVTPTLSTDVEVALDPFAPRYETRGSTRIPLRVADPGGGAPWAVRLFQGRARTRMPNKDVYLSPWALCAQLGRLVGGRFGWITDRDGFQPVPVEGRDRLPETCQTARGLAREGAATRLLTTVRLGRDGQPGASRTILFGRTRGARAQLEDRGRPLAGNSRQGAFLTFGPTDPALRDLGLRVKRTEAAPKRTGLSGALGGGDALPSNAAHQGRPVLGSERVAARAPDPAGGPAYGLLAARSTRPGEWCVGSATRLLGRRPGFLNTRLETFQAQYENVLCPDDRYPLDENTPVAFSFERAAATPGEDTDAGRVQRRGLPGASRVFGRAAPGVRTLEITTSRDIRTLAPDPTTGAWIATYEGNLPGEEITVTAVFADGTRVPSTLRGP